MTTKTLTTFVAAGYTLASQYDTLDIATTGGVGGTGVLLNHLATLENYGEIHSSANHNGVHATDGGTIVNGLTAVIGASIYGYSGIFAETVATSVSNYGSIEGVGRFGNGVFLTAGGQVTNGAAADTTAYIQGDNAGIAAGGAATAVINFGTVAAVYSNGVDLALGGTVTNGTAADTVARITAYEAWAIDIRGAAGTVANFGSIASTLSLATPGGVYLRMGGTVTNGSARDSGAAILAYSDGIHVKYGAAAVVNYGTIRSSGSKADAVHFEGVGYPENELVTNGSAKDTVALIQGAVNGVYSGRFGTVNNFGTIVGEGASFSAGVLVSRLGAVTNGSAADTEATIAGYEGVFLDAGVVANFGTIVGTAREGVCIQSGSVINGSADDGAASIVGKYGVETGYLGLNATVTNFGTISGTGGTAVRLGSATATLALEAGCAFVGAVLGDGGTLDLDTGTGTLTGDLASGAVTVSGSMAATPFTNFGTVEIGAAASFATSGAVTIGAGQSVIVSGFLTIGAKKIANGGTIETVGGTMTVTGKVTGAGEAIVKAGLLDFTSSFNQNVTFVGGVGTLELAKSQSYGGTVAGFSKADGTFLDLADIAFSKSTTATYAGTKTGGVLTVTDGTHTAHIDLIGNYLSSTFVAAIDGHGGTIVHDPTAPAAAVASPHRLIAAMARLGAGGAGPIHAAVEPWRRDAQSLAKPA